MHVCSHFHFSLSLVLLYFLSPLLTSFSTAFEKDYLANISREKSVLELYHHFNTSRRKKVASFPRICLYYPNEEF